jgi:choice-of-anchor A domain-containing protein
MRLTVLKNLLIVGAMSASAAANASALTDYNIILSGDFNVSGGSGHIEGKTFIGGNIVNGSIYAQYVDASRLTTEDTVKVVGNFNVNNGTHVESGYVAFGGTTNAAGYNGLCNSSVPGMSGTGCLKHVTDGSLVVEKTSLFAELAADSAFYSGLSSSVGASVTGDMNNKTLKYTGAATDLAVFNLTMTDLSGPNWAVDFGSAVNVLINVTGTEFNAGTTKTNGFSNSVNNVLWNFSDATTLNFGDSWYGSILALNATIFTGSNLNGAIAAKSYVGNGEIHNGSWGYTITQVPEPSALMLTMLGLGFVALIRIRRRAK